MEPLNWDAPEPQEWDGATARVAPPARRLAGFIVDVLVIVVILFFVVVSFVDVDELAPTEPIPTRVLFVSQLIVVVYMVSFTATRGQTPGKMAARTKVVDMDTGEIPSWSQAFVRETLPVLVGAIPTFGFLTFVIYAWLLWDPRNQGLHDKAARTLVIDIDRLRR